MNRELFQKIHDAITPSFDRGTPGLLDMGTWESRSPECGTTRCIAGWGIHLTTGKPLYADDMRTQDPSVIELAKELGAEIYDDFDEEADIHDLAARLLGLAPADTELFYSEDGVAVRFVKLAAEGKEREARQLLAEAE